MGEDFAKVCQVVSDCGGRIVFAGVGQSAHAARKSAASMASLGKPSFYVHATEALHGDMGMITPEDVVILISHSGETKETLNMLSVLKNLGPKTMALTGNPESTLARNCDLVLATHIKKEAGTIQFAPTSSALATIALLDVPAECCGYRARFQREGLCPLPSSGFSRQDAPGRQVLVGANIPAGKDSVKKAFSWVKTHEKVAWYSA